MKGNIILVYRDNMKMDLRVLMVVYWVFKTSSITNRFKHMGARWFCVTWASKQLGVDDVRQGFLKVVLIEKSEGRTTMQEHIRWGLEYHIHRIMWSEWWMYIWRMQANFARTSWLRHLELQQDSIADSNDSWEIPSQPKNSLCSTIHVNHVNYGINCLLTCVDLVGSNIKCNRCCYWHCIL